MALATAGAYLRRSTYSFERYLQEYEKNWIVDQHWSAKLPEYERTLYTTWEISYDRLKREDDSAARMLGLLAYFSNRRLWHDLFKAGLSNRLPGPEWLYRIISKDNAEWLLGLLAYFSNWRVWDTISKAGLSEDSPEWLSKIISNDSAFESAMRELTDYCFLEVSTEAWSMHACVHDWTFASLNRVPDKTQYQYAVDCVVSLIGGADQKKSLSRIEFSDLAVHALRLEHICRHHDALLESAPRRIERVETITDLLREQSQLAAAERLLRRTLQMCEETLVSNHHLTLSAINKLGSIYRVQGKLEKSEAMYSRALQGKEETLGPTHKSTLLALISLGFSYERRGKLKEAEGMYLRALQRKERALGANHPSTLNIVQILGVLYGKQGRTEEAEEMYLRAVQGQEEEEEELEAKHTDTIWTIPSLGVLYRRCLLYRR